MSNRNIKNCQNNNNQDRKTSNSEKLLDLSSDGNIRDYIWGDTLGHGAFGTVRKATHCLTGREVAIKVVNKANIINMAQRCEKLRTEVAILMKVKHPNIVRLFDVFEDLTCVYVVMELMTGGAMVDQLIENYPNGYSESQASTMIRKILSAVGYLHDQKIIHRDLKPENLLLTDTTAQAETKISDFGLAKMCEGETIATTVCGSPSYVAPEVLHEEAYNSAVDMWSLGVLLYVMVCGFLPWHDDNIVVLLSIIKEGKYDFPSPWWDNISNECKDLIENLLVVDPSKRYTVQQALDHPWIQNNAIS